VATLIKLEHAKSKGLGRVERWIAEEIARDKEARQGKPGSVLVSSWTLVCHYQNYDHYDWDWKPSEAQRKAILRAMLSYVRKHPQYALVGGQGRKLLFLYEPGDPVSAMWAQLCMKRRKLASRSEAEAAVARGWRRHECGGEV
jgi:hypothetical protein